MRTTEDVDILTEPTEENARRVIEALGRLPDGAAKELPPRDLLEHVVVKIADEVEVSCRAWMVAYAEASADACEAVVEGVRIPFLSLDHLTASKEMYPERDQLDRDGLAALRARQRGSFQ